MRGDKVGIAGSEGEAGHEASALIDAGTVAPRGKAPEAAGNVAVRPGDRGEELVEQAGPPRCAGLSEIVFAGRRGAIEMLHHFSAYGFEARVARGRKRSEQTAKEIVAARRKPRTEAN